ncbi:hypothetical protein [Flavobacterium sp.]|uniref:hypothetical protein n=1 Tax=Flavobacterium sp. TaxID=239 RepID=UPI003750FB7B
MQVIKDNRSLAKAIADLENVKKSEANLLKEHFNFTVDSLNPINMVKEKFNETFNSPDLKGKIFSTLFSVGTGLLTNNLIVGSSLNPIKKIAANLIQNQIVSLSQNTDAIKEKGVTFLQDTLQKLKIK